MEYGHITVTEQLDVTETRDVLVWVFFLIGVHLLSSLFFGAFVSEYVSECVKAGYVKVTRQSTWKRKQPLSSHQATQVNM